MSTVTSGKSNVGVGVTVNVGVIVGVGVSVGVCVIVGVNVTVGVSVGVAVAVWVAVGVGVAVGVAKRLSGRRGKEAQRCLTSRNENAKKHYNHPTFRMSGNIIHKDLDAHITTSTAL
jgi:hypothetical protein